MVAYMFSYLQAFIFMQMKLGNVISLQVGVFHLYVYREHFTLGKLIAMQLWELWPLRPTEKQPQDGFVNS